MGPQRGDNSARTMQRNTVILPHYQYAKQEAEIRKRLHSQIVFGVGCAGLVISFLINPGFDVRPTMAFVPTAMLLCAVCVAIVWVTNFRALRALSMSYTALLSLGFRIQLDAMGELGPYWAAVVSVEIILGTALVFNSRAEYLISCLISVVTLFAGQPSSYFATVSAPLLSLSIVSSVLIGCLLNHAVMNCIREIYITKQKFKKLSSVDALTGLSNRRAFMEHFQSTLAEPKGPLRYFAMIDIDNFKGINDKYGHEMGDRVLVAFARQSTQMFSATEVGRLGGEEFGVLLGGPTDADAMAAMESFLAQVREDMSGAVPFTFSAGLLPIDFGDDATLVLRKADAALYLAKRLGKARIIWAEAEMQDGLIGSPHSASTLPRDRTFRSRPVL